MSSHEVLNQKTKQRYSLYAQFYPLLSLLAYYVIWRGNIFRHIRFFRDIVQTKIKILDIATGDGSLTAVALRPDRNDKIAKLICLDISPEMLAKAKTKLKVPKCELVVGDVQQMPFENGEFAAISCFGGFNSFPDGPGALREIYRVLASQGRVRGSVLLLPNAPWKQKKIQQWIQEGYQTQTISIDQFKRWVHDAKFSVSTEVLIGDVLLFELIK
ncbi:MAG: class I SAM-dependent methyltransferase [Bdellovibrionaceae bacterium]|nr:class I SAM-dependent methyltransferase [Pseudobdellovibrionaceae bacterium]